MPVRLLAALAAVLGVLAVPASAGATCRLVTDEAGDQGLFVSGTGAAVSTDLDVVSADVSANLKHVVVAVRLATLKAYDPMAPVLRRYVVSFVANGVDYRFVADLGQVGGAYAANEYDYAIPATLAVDLRAREIRVAMDASLVAGRVSRRTVFSQISVLTGTYWGLRAGTTTVGPSSTTSSGFGQMVAVDDAATDASYRATTPTCVPMPG